MAKTPSRADFDAKPVSNYVGIFSVVEVNFYCLIHLFFSVFYILIQ